MTMKALFDREFSIRLSDDLSGFLWTATIAGVRVKSGKFKLEDGPVAPNETEPRVHSQVVRAYSSAGLPVMPRGRG